MYWTSIGILLEYELIHHINHIILVTLVADVETVGGFLLKTL